MKETLENKVEFISYGYDSKAFKIADGNLYYRYSKEEGYKLLKEDYEKEVNRKC